MKRSWLLIALLLSIGVNIGILATVGLARARAERAAWSSAGKPEGERIAPRVERLAERLRLSEDEKSAFVDQHRRFFDTLEEIRRELETAKEELRREVGAPNPDRERIEALLAESARLNARMERAFVDNVIATRGILDEARQQVYLDLLRHRRDYGERGERGRRRPGDGTPGERPPD